MDQAAETAIAAAAARADRLLARGNFVEAAGPAREAADLAARAYGAGHWQTFDAARRLRLAETGRELPADQRKRLTEAIGAEAQARGLEGSAPAEAEKLALRAGEGYAAALGEQAPEHAHAWHLVGRIRGMTNDARGAKEANQKALAIRRQVLPEGHPDIARSLHNLGLEQAKLGDYAEARTSHEQALVTRRMALPPGHPDIAQSLTNLGNMQAKLGDYAGAKASLEEDLAIRRKALPSGHPLIAQSLANLGLVQMELGYYKRAKESFEEALRIRRQAYPPDRPIIASSLSSLGNAQFELEDYAGARASHEQALGIIRKAFPTDDPRIAESLIRLGNAQTALKEYAAAAANLEQALSIRRKAFPADDPRIAESLTNLGAVQTKQGEYARARASFMQALGIYRTAPAPDRSHVAKTLNNLARVQWASRDYAAAKESYEQALDIFRKALSPGHPTIARSLNNLGLMQYELGDYAGAKASHEQALGIRRKAFQADDPIIARTLDRLGVVQRALRQYESAKASHEQALAIFRKALPPDDSAIAVSLNGLGIVQAALGDYTGAKASHEQALQIHRKARSPDHLDIAGSLNNLGAVQVELRDYDEARVNLEQALSILRKALPEGHRGSIQSLFNLGLRDLSAGDPTAATATNLGEALAIERSYLLALAGAQAEAEQLQAAAAGRYTLSLYLSAVLDPEVGAEAAVVYDRAARLKGLVTARQRWARQLRDAADPDTRGLLDQLQAVNLRLLRAALGSDQPSGASDEEPTDPAADLARFDAERKDLERRLVARSAAFRRYQQKAELGGAAIRAALPEGVCLVDVLEYIHVGPPPREKADPVHELRVLAFVVCPGDQPVRLVELGPADRIDALVRRWRERYVDHVPAAFDGADPGTELRERVWLKLEPHLGRPGVVLVSPDGALNFLPLAALPGKQPDTFLVQEYAFAVAPAPVLLPELLARAPGRPQGPSLLLIGGVDFGKVADIPVTVGRLPAVPTDWPELGGTDREVDDLRARFQQAFPTASAPAVLKEDRATKAAFVAAAPGHAYVHLATHGFFADENEASALDPVRGSKPILFDRAVSGRNPGVLSGVVFAGINRPPGGAVADCLLTTLEASELDLRGAELVTLSACQTGEGRTAGGEGAVGLQRAFQVGGARAVVASLWKVPDAATQELMTRFYANLWEEEMPALEALRRAQLGLLRREVAGRPLGPGLVLRPRERLRQAPPFYWAAFTLSGDWR